MRSGRASGDIKRTDHTDRHDRWLLASHSLAAAALIGYWGWQGVAERWQYAGWPVRGAFGAGLLLFALLVIRDVRRGRVGLVSALLVLALGLVAVALLILRGYLILRL